MSSDSCSNDPSFYFFECPHCQGEIIVDKKDVNCAIFRHGVHKSNLQPIDPHLPKDMCDRLYLSGRIHGCGKPFRLILNDPVRVEICDYI
jgi:hypothetical protein